MAEQEVRIPDIGDAQDVEVIEVLVAVGDHVEADGALIVIESDKASMEVPSPASGEVKRIDVSVGDSVTEGQLIVVLDVAKAEAAPKKEPPAKKPPAAEAPPPAEKPKAAERAPTEAKKARAAGVGVSRLEVRVPDIGDAKDVVVIEVAVKPGADVQVDDLLIVLESDKASMEVPAPAEGKVLEVPIKEGDEVSEGTLLVVLEAAAGAARAAEPAESKPAKEPDAPAREIPANAPAPEPAEAAPEPPAGTSVYAGPAVRRLARELGVDLAQVNGSGTRGRIVKDDVQAFVKRVMTGAPQGQATSGGIPAMPDVDYSKFGPVEKTPLTRIRARGAANLHRSWLNVVHVTQHDDADVTDLEDFRASLKADAEAKGVKLTPLPFIMKACVHALREFPTFNASLDKDVKSLWRKSYYHIGFAVDTEAGLMVPVVREVDRKGVYEIAADIASLSERARTQKSKVDDLQGGTFSISSLGSIGGTGFTPIVNAPEVAILGVSRLTVKPTWNGKEFVPRKMLPLSLSYDHRAINGAEAGRFTVFLCEVLRDLRRVLL